MTVFCCIISFLLYFGLVVIVSKQAVKELFIGKNTQKEGAKIIELDENLKNGNKTVNKY